MRIYFARHGESQANVLHEIANRGLRHGLTRAGRAQAEALAETLKGESITRIYTSPVLRAIETAVIVANRLDLDYEINDALREFDCGVAEGHADQASWEMWSAVMDAWLVDGDYDRRIEGGESFADIKARFAPFIQGLVDRYRDSNEALLCIAHGGLYRLMLPLVSCSADATRIAVSDFGYAACIVVKPGPQGLVRLR
jgi:probable phosphoglycerate mutase